MTKENLSGDDANTTQPSVTFSSTRRNLQWASVFVGGLVAGCFLVFVGILVGSALQSETATSDSSESDVTPGQGDSATSISESSSAQETGRQEAATAKLAYNVPSEYLQSLSASRRICFMMNNGATASLAIKFTLDPDGIAASGEMFKRNVPKPTQFSLDGLRVMGAINTIKESNDSSEAVEKDVAKFSAVSLNKAYSECGDKFTEAEVKSLRDYYSSLGL
jgi:hypothetical protein